MDRDEILRDDFPTARKGWQPEAVGAHLIAVADHVAAITAAAKPTPAADAASEQVGTVLAAAETAAAAIVADAEADADRIRAEARAEADRIRAKAETESERTVTAADREASGRVEQARGAVEGLIAQADRLRAQVGALGRDLASNVPGSRSEQPSEPDPEPEPESISAAEPEPAPASPAEPAVAKPPPSDEELIAELRGGEFVAAQATPTPTLSDSDPDQGAARLVAMNMALDGASRERIAAQIESEFGSFDGVDRLVDDVLGRAGR